MNQLSMPVAEVLRDVGIRQSADHANRVTPGWTEAAFVAIRAHCMTLAEIVTGEDLVDLYHSTPGRVAPPTDKAFGAVIKRLLRENVIRQVDFDGKRRKGHCSPCARYASCVVGKRWTDQQFDKE